ncbi:phosphotransferase [Deinococcus taeanensis]
MYADLHSGNLRWCRGRLSVFDFDDSGLGLPA